MIQQALQADDDEQMQAGKLYTLISLLYKVNIYR